MSFYAGRKQITSSQSTCIPDDSFCSGFRRKAQVINWKPFLVAKRGFMVPGVPCLESGNWRRECVSLLFRVIGLREERNVQKAVICEVSFRRTHAFIRSSHTQRWRSSFRDGPWIIFIYLFIYFPLKKHEYNIFNKITTVKKKWKGHKYINLIICPLIKYIYFRIKRKLGRKE